jgi:hypothetical protein
MPQTFKPFADIRECYTLTPNFAYDVCMPGLSNAGWRVLCVAIRKTLGWVADDAQSNRDRKEWDQISYSQFMDASGLKSPSSVNKGIQENLEAGYLIRRQVATYQGTGAPVYAYALNQAYEVTVYGSTTESVVETAEPQTSTTESVVESTTESVVAATTVSVETKGKKEKILKEKEDLSWDPWPKALRTLQGSMAKATFDQHFTKAAALLEGGRLVIAVQNPLSLPMLDKQLRPVVERAVRSAAGEALAVEFRAAV